MLIWRGIWIYGPAEISINRRKSIALSTWSLVLYLFGIKELLENTGSPPRMILPPGDTGCRLETFLVVIAGEGCSWHLLGRGQGCCWTSYNARDSPPSHPRHTHIHREREKNYLADANSAKAEKPCSGLILNIELWLVDQRLFLAQLWFSITRDSFVCCVSCHSILLTDTHTFM